MNFHLTNEGLYAFKVPRKGFGLIQTVHDNERMFTPRQIESAKQARDLYEMIGRPSYQKFMNIIQNNLLQNVKITVKDICHAECIYGKELGTGESIFRYNQMDSNSDSVYSLSLLSVLNIRFI